MNLSNQESTNDLYESDGQQTETMHCHREGFVWDEEKRIRENFDKKRTNHGSKTAALIVVLMYLVPVGLIVAGVATGFFAWFLNAVVSLIVFAFSSVIALFLVSLLLILGVVLLTLLWYVFWTVVATIFYPDGSL